MKPIHVTLTADPMIPVPPTLYGGIERVIDMLARGLVERGHDVTLFAHRDSDTAGRLAPYGGTRPNHPIDLIQNTMSIARLAIARPDVVHSFGRLATLLPLLPTSLPKIMSYQREPTLLGPPSDTARETGYLIIYRVQRAYCGIDAAHRPQLRRVQRRPTRDVHVPNRVQDDAPLVFLGRVERIKGAHTAVEVARRSGRRLVIAGNVSDDAYFEAEVRPHLSDRIEYVGPVDDGQKNELLGSALAFLMPIEWEEPFGIVMAEALACGTPVIGTPQGSVPEIVVEGVTGFVRDTVEGMATAVEHVAALSRAACRDDCEARFSDRAIVDAYEELYRERIEAAQARPSTP